MNFNTIWDWATAHPIWASLAAIGCALALLATSGAIVALTRRYRAYPWYVIVLVVVGCLTLFGPHVYFVVFLLGMLTAFTEILGKFPDEPIKALRTAHALCYHIFNGVIAVSALFILQVMGVPDDTQLDEVKLAIVAGLGSMMIMRSKLFSVKMGDKEVSVGPDQIIKTFFDYMEDAIDRVRAQSRVDFVTANLKKLNVEKVCAYSTTMLGAAQALDAAEREDMIKKIGEICTGGPDDPQLKQYRLGFLLLNRMGEDFVTMLIKKAPANCRAEAERPAAAAGWNPFNAEPQEETAFYFAYERDMMVREMIDRLRWEDTTDEQFKAETTPTIAKLAHHKVIYNAPNPDPAELTGMPNIAADPTGDMEGIVYKIGRKCIDFLTLQRPDFNEDKLTVTVAGKRVTAVVYVAKHPRDNLTANPIVAQAVVIAAETNGLSGEYVARLQALVPV